VSAARLVSVNVGLPREVDWHGRAVRTSIWKSSVEGPVRVRSLNLEGDQQSDLSVHGGRDKAVYAYPREHYDYWRRELPGQALPWGSFGENLTTEGLLEPDVRIGDRFRAGSTELVVTQPRMPCFKLGIRFGRDDMVKRFVASGRSGFYVRVVREGEIEAGDAIRVVESAGASITVSDIFALKFDDDSDGVRGDELRRAANAPGLAPSWRDGFLKRLEG